MKRTSLAVTVASLLVFRAIAMATHPEPAKANRASFALVNGFFGCDSPNTAMQSNGHPACAPVTGNGTCVLGPKGSGKITFAKTGSATSGTQDIKIRATVRGIENCDGFAMNVRLLYRLTSDDCPEGSCTATDDPIGLDLIASPCIVTNGACKVKTTLNTAAPGEIPPNGKNTGIEIFGCGLKGPLFPLFAPDLQCGLLLK